MEELKRINALVKMKQIGRAAGGLALLGIGIYLIEEFFYQYGITEFQKAIAAEFPEEYASMTAKIVKEFENN